MMLKIEHIDKSFGSKKVLDDLNLCVNDSSIFGLVGINGAGNAALLAAQILAVDDEDLNEKLVQRKRAMHDAVLEKDARMQEEVKGL